MLMLFDIISVFTRFFLSYFIFAVAWLILPVVVSLFSQSYLVNIIRLAEVCAKPYEMVGDDG